ncbi:hypothetical protein CEK28_15340 [Xenophilus sp. AP218F]|nr:hypothetical protein [Chromobacterium sp. ASV5]OWY37792.1 hypothetical protein CEK28_15340 [Xenophilus sp. AP218F]
MKTSIRLLAMVALCSILAGCVSLSPDKNPSLADGCVGAVLPPPAGMRETTDEALLSAAVAAPGKGGLCLGKVFQQTAGAVMVYRVWDASKPASRLGRWWSFSAPAGSVEEYRRANAICPAWSQLNAVERCVLVKGAKVAAGPGQSATCSDALAYPPSAVNQVYVPNAQDATWVEDCQPLGPFPAAGG